MAAHSSPLHSAADNRFPPDPWLSQMVAEATQGICACEQVGAADLRIIFVNAAFERLTLWPKASAQGRPLLSLLQPRSGVVEGWGEISSAIEQRRARRKVLQIARRDGTLCWADLHLTPLSTTNGAIPLWSVMITEAASGTETVETPRQAEHPFSTEHGRDLVAVTRQDGTLSFVSPSCRPMLGFEPEEIIGRPLSDFVHPDNRAAAHAALAEHFRGQHESALVHRLRRKDGSYLWAETVSKTRNDPQLSAPVEVVSTIRDITKRRQMEESLQSVHKLLDSVYDAVPIGLALIDNSDQILQCNRAFAELFGIDRALGGSQPITQFIAPSELSRAGTASAGLECECHTAHGPIPTELLIAPLDPAVGASRLVVITDLRERKKMEERLREASQLESLGTLAGGIAHDFNNMLAIILGYASLLRDATEEPDRIAHYADTIIDAGRRGADVVRQLQLFANTQDTELSVLDIHLLLDEVITKACDDWPANITIVRHYGTGNPSLTADAVQLTQALQKLLENARDAMPEGGVLTVRTSEVRQSTFSPGANGEILHFLRVSIEDSGTGMDAETRARMFQPFFARNKSSENHGLGLAVVYGIMRAHRGSIEVDSAPGRGTAVHLLFPQKPASTGSNPPLPIDTGRARSNRQTVLLVEDEQDIGALWMEVLPSEGWRVLWARDGTEALRLFRAHRDEIALVFTDIGLPVMDGWQVAATIRAEVPEMPLLIASGAFRPGDKQRGFAEPVAYLSKPYVLTAVVKQIQKLIPA